MSDSYQQDQSCWEWMDQEEQHWLSNNISEQASTEAEKQIIDQMLVQFDSMFGLSEESN